MLVLLDFHHEDLYHSLWLLFEKRLGFQAYRPIGMDWYHQGFWSVFPHIDTAQQYLSLEALAPEVARRNQFESLSSDWESNIEGTYLVNSALHPAKYRALTLDQFKQMKFDIILCSMPQHIDKYWNLKDQFQPQAKFIFQVGNNWHVPDWIPNVLSSATGARISDRVNVVYYHQEFNVEALRGPLPTNPRHVVSMSHYMQDPDLFFDLERRLSSWTFKAHGAGNRDGSVPPPFHNIANTFKNTGFLMHIKKEGGGYEYNIHHAAAAGRPMILKKKHFRGMTADQLLENGKTCIDIEGLDPMVTVDLLEKAASEYPEWSKRVTDRFNQVINFDEEEQKIRKFIENLR
jgi:hypothetical protein